ncbi:flagellar biosynthesis protein FlhF [Cohnella massiliensis]|uniref:flagellar biosynthesis protein FlhF n=1 Tax=Cohnella massiliensis TaxID=1816691 RepID=UPI0009B93A6C|nr:flagellar biosynthesis protein FlhF [Cohnella massiliensis]
MKVKRYVAGDLPEAVQKIRSELGKDAVILNTKEIRVGGFLGMFRKKRVEVIAAVDEGAAKPAPRPPTASPKFVPPSPAKLAPALSEEPSDGKPKEVLPPQAVRERYSRGTGDAVSPKASAPSAAATAVKALPEAEEQRREVAVSSFAAAMQSALNGQSEAAESPPARKSEPPVLAQRAESSFETIEKEEKEEDEVSALLQELRSMKEMMIRINRQQNAQAMPAAVLKLSKRLASQGVEPVYVEQFAQTVIERLEEHPDPDDEEFRQTARELLREWLLPSVGQGISPNTRIVNFVGPTGVGKTTTIAKIAADQAFIHRRSVGFITADTYRIAAVDQLRTYADILNVPLEVVFSPSELTRAYKKLEDRDLLLMDTAGRNYRNELFVSEVNSLLAPGQQAENLLVLSLTHKYSDLKEVASQFAKYGVRRLLLTKTDETDSYGSVLNLAREFDFEISYITCGQTVPDDIRAFEPDEWVNRLLGDASDG